MITPDFFPARQNQSFHEIWPSLQQIDPHIQLLGGYGLYLKQMWLADQFGKIASLIPLSQWTGELTPRTTKDIDVGISLNLITSSDKQEKLVRLLEQKGYVPHKDKKLWGWVLGNENQDTVELEFSTCPPSIPQENLAIDKIRVKKKPGLTHGIHAHTNRELIGFEHSFSFDYSDLTLTVPNIITSAMMKLKAFQDRIDSYRHSPKKQADNLFQSEKHARDILRIVAMETEAELQLIPPVKSTIRNTPLFEECRTIIHTSFLEQGQIGFEFTKNQWSESTQSLILRELTRWFEL